MRFGKPQKRKGAVPSAVRVVLRRAASLKNARSFRAAGPAPAAPVGSRGSRSLPFVNRAEERFCDAGECRPRGPLRSAGCGQLRQGMKGEVSGGDPGGLRALKPPSSPSFFPPPFHLHPSSGTLQPSRNAPRNAARNAARNAVTYRNTIFPSRSNRNDDSAPSRIPFGNQWKKPLVETPSCLGSSAPQSFRAESRKTPVALGKRGPAGLPPSVENEINGAPVMGLRKPPTGRPPSPEGPVSTKAGRAPPGLAWSVGRALGRLF